QGCSLRRGRTGLGPSHVRALRGCVARVDRRSGIRRSHEQHSEVRRLHDSQRASTTLSEAEWNATIIRDVPTDVPRLKQEHDLPRDGQWPARHHGLDVRGRALMSGGLLVPKVRLMQHRRGLILGSLLLATFAINLDITIVNVALPSLVRELHASNSDLQWIVDAYSLVFAALVLAAGNLSDRRGRKGVLLRGLAVFALATFAAC